MGNKRSNRVPDRFNRQSAGLDVWQRLTRFVVLGSFVGLGLLFFSFFTPEWEKLRAQDDANGHLEQHRDTLRETKEKKVEERLRGVADREYLELIARDKLNLQLPGETIIRIDRDREAG